MVGCIGSVGFIEDCVEDCSKYFLIVKFGILGMFGSINSSTLS